MAIHAAWLPTTGQGRVDTRLALSTGMAPSTNLTSRAGIMADGGLTLQQTAAMQCQISPGRAYIQGTAAQGAYPIALDTAVPLTVPDGDPQFGRIDLIVLKVQDDQFDGSGLTQASLVLITGTPAAAPVPPTVPPASLPLYQISVPTKTSAGTGGISWSTAVTDLRVYTAALGGIVPAGTTAWTPPAAAQYTDLNGLLQRYNGSAWAPVYDPATQGNLPQFTSTSRPTGVPVGKQIYETDTGRVSMWNGTAWVSEWDPTSYTSSARPTANWPGRAIYETDTSNYSMWTGSAWVPVAHNGAWTPYSPVWTADTTNPVLGNGLLNGSFHKVGNKVTARVRLTIGSTTTQGSGKWNLSLPFPAAIPPGFTGGEHAWSGNNAAYSVSNWDRHGVVVVVAGATTVFCFNDAAAAWGAGAPQTWGTGDTWAISVTYESNA